MKVYLLALTLALSPLMVGAHTPNANSCQEGYALGEVFFTFNPFHIHRHCELVVVPPPVDLCPDVDGVQLVLPCPVPPPLPDLCPEEGVQTELPCAVPPLPDLCPEEGVQTELPCAVVEPPIEPVDNCPLDPGIQTEDGQYCKTSNPHSPKPEAPSSGRREKGGINWCMPGETTFCRVKEPITADQIRGQIILLIQELIAKLEEEIKNL